ncbi:Protein of unknown function (DUF3626) [Seminavis robusta]|uniref:Uncharacterized protein n=1 Tax=Seminavis robusta TaxID=568900 RepID=A0A9N8D5S1_9STRA|nr:Protein of unknown function (DUF3626) [Seminavis robusta]|eukprot:Sro11_g008870.1 Protein of unknown function (DUF3626) (553) ;mRNA; r:178388-180046
MTRRTEKLKRNLHRSKVWGSLSQQQKTALNRVEVRAKERHDQALPKLEKRVVSLGFTTEDLYKCLEYIRDEAPLIINLSVDTLSKLLNDTHYRNSFEIRATGANRTVPYSSYERSREWWEEVIFDDGYYDAPASERPKYGCLNITGAVTGVASAKAYGRLHLILKQDLRNRSTLFDCDTGNYLYKHGEKDAVLATTEYYAHVMNWFNDNDLIATLRRSVLSNKSNYKEIQIHGPVELARDVEALSIPYWEFSASATLLGLVRRFQQKTGCRIIWQYDVIGLSKATEISEPGSLPSAAPPVSKEKPEPKKDSAAASDPVSACASTKALLPKTPDSKKHTPVPRTAPSKSGASGESSTESSAKISEASKDPPGKVASTGPATYVSAKAPLTEDSDLKKTERRAKRDKLPKKDLPAAAGAAATDETPVAPKITSLTKNPDQKKGEGISKAAEAATPKESSTMEKAASDDTAGASTTLPTEACEHKKGIPEVPEVKASTSNKKECKSFNQKKESDGTAAAESTKTALAARDASQEAANIPAMAELDTSSWATCSVM